MLHNEAGESLLKTKRCTNARIWKHRISTEICFARLEAEPAVIDEYIRYDIHSCVRKLTKFFTRPVTRYFLEFLHTTRFELDCIKYNCTYSESQVMNFNRTLIALRTHTV
jgi:hypothetical protein